MSAVLQDEIFWSLVMPWALFIGLFVIPRKPFWFRHYAFPGAFIAAGIVLAFTLAKGIGAMSLVLGLVAWWATGESKVRPNTRSPKAP